MTGPDDSTAVPVIDISTFFTGDISQRRAVARDIDAACRSIGFLVISGHGVPETLIKEAQRVANGFFDLPLERKRRIVRSAPGTHRGYRGIEASVLAYSRGDKSAAPDHRELFSVGRLDVDLSDQYYAGPEGARTFIPNVWPDGPEDFEKVVSAYYRAMENLSLALMRMFALALGLDEFWFDRKVDKHFSSLQLSFYPNQHREPQAGQLRASAHSDWGSLTILKAEDRPGGLEVFTARKQWEPVQIVPETFIVNIGDLMAQWTNDRWVSTLHRVVNPPRDKAEDSRRLSLVYFHNPNYDAVVECLPTCVDAPPKYAAVTSGEYLQMRVNQAFR